MKRTSENHHNKNPDARVALVCGNRIRKNTDSTGAKNRLRGASGTRQAPKMRVQSTLTRILNDSSCYTRTSNAVGVDAAVSSSAGKRLYHKKKTLKDATKRCKQCNLKWLSQVLEYVQPLLSKLPEKERRALESLFGLRAYSGAIRASDMAAKRKFGLICVDEVYSYACALPRVRWYHITLFGDELHVSERRPALALKKLKGKAYKEIQELGLSGLCWIDVDPVPNYPQKGKGGTFMFHVHALGFTDRDFDVDAARQKLKRSRSWSCKLKADATDITEITSRMGTPAWWAYYGAKPPYRAKRCKILPDGTARLRWTDKGYRPQLAMRLAEGLAHMALMDTLFAVGDGKEMREDIRRRLAAWHRKRWRDQRRLELPPLGKLFKKVWGFTRARKYKSWRIVGATV